MHRFNVLRTALLLILLAIVVWTIITIELTLKYNNVNGVYELGSTGQLIPFIIGVANMGKTLNAIWVNLIKKVSYAGTAMSSD